MRLCDSIIGLILEQSELGTRLGGERGEQLMEDCGIQVTSLARPYSLCLSENVCVCRDLFFKRFGASTWHMSFVAPTALQRAMLCSIAVSNEPTLPWISLQRQ